MEGSQDLPTWFSDSSGIEMKISMEHWWNDTDAENQSTWGKLCPSATLSTTNLVCIHLVSNQDLYDERPANTCLNSISHSSFMDDGHSYFLPLTFTV